MNQIAILGSSRSFGYTRKALDTIIQGSEIEVIDLKNLNIMPYDYLYQNQSDDFKALMERIITFDTIILATPVYWYTMSALMKIFIDRLSDLLDVQKDMGRRLRGKNIFVVSSFATSLPKGFEDTFEQICTYLGMNYRGTSFICSDENNVECYKNNVDEIEKAKFTLQIKRS